MLRCRVTYRDPILLRHRFGRHPGLILPSHMRRSWFRGDLQRKYRWPFSYGDRTLQHLNIVELPSVVAPAQRATIPTLPGQKINSMRLFKHDTRRIGKTSSSIMSAALPGGHRTQCRNQASYLMYRRMCPIVTMWVVHISQLNFYILYSNVSEGHYYRAAPTADNPPNRYVVP